jgi:[ribosomal protein S18]-alanine N-acetyltransferase
MPMTILKPQTTIRPADQEDRQRLANLIHFEVYVHRHLDWRTPLDWIGFPPYFVMEQRKSLLAALACPPDPPMVAWIRLFAVTQDLSVERTWEALWQEASGQLASMNDVKWAAALALWPWFADVLEAHGFEENNRVVMLNWDAGSKLPESRPSEVIVRPMNFDDIGGVHDVDTASFTPVWQNSRPSLELAYRQAAVATVAEYQKRMVGYQISTATPIGGHLARLAVVPDCQGHGIGAALVGDLLMQFKRRGAKKVTVNTQKDNPGSLNLYQKNGFYLTGEEYPVYLLNLK